LETEHSIEMHRYIPHGQKNHHWIAICSCKRWRSDPFRKRDDAETKGLAHSIRGDEHLRALAAQNHGNIRLTSVHKYYEQMANDPFTDLPEQQAWQRLADELARVMKGDGSEQAELF
jgi:hypothetical protein